MGPIYKTHFSLTSLNKDAYEILIQFADEKEILSKKTFTFVQEAIPKLEKTFDIWTKNGECSASLLETLFNKKDLGLVKKNAQLLKKTEQVVAVLDLKDPDTHYLSQDESISICEGYVSDFFQKKESGASSKNAKKLQAFFQKENPLDFLICEGSLKHALLQKGNFSDHEVEFLNGSSGSIP